MPSAPVPLPKFATRAARAAQEANRKRSIPNWYSLEDRLVSDTGEVVLLHSPHSPEAAGRA